MYRFAPKELPMCIVRIKGNILYFCLFLTASKYALFFVIAKVNVKRTPG